MPEPIVDVIIPVHTEQRPIARATASVLATANAATRVTVVCHNIDSARIGAQLGTWARDSRVRLMHLEDGIPSAAGPINAGLDAATGEFTTLLGSDDEYEAGAIDAWVDVARRDDADVVIPPLRAAPGGRTKSPPTRPWRRRHLDGVRDRLAYRTVQLGLVRRELFAELRMTVGLRSGEDIIQGATIWYSGASITRLRRGPGYLIHEDAPEQRVSSSRKPAAESLRFLDTILADEFMAGLRETQRQAFTIKLLRTHIMDILGASLRDGATTADLAALASAIRRLTDVSPDAMKILSRRDARILRGVLQSASPAELAAEHAAHTDYRRLGTLIDNVLPDSARHLLHREAPPRFLAATALMR